MHIIMACIQCRFCIIIIINDDDNDDVKKES